MLKKRLTSIFLSIFIVFGVVASDYCTVMAVDIPTAFWGTLEYSRAFFTAMQTGGALDRGINFDDFTKSTQRQWMDLAPKVMEAYQLFCFYKEKVVVSSEHPDWTMEQINSEAVTRSLKLKNDFENNAIKVSNTTGTITLKDWGYWREFCKEFSNVAQNGLSSGGDTIGDNTSIYGNIFNSTNFTFSQPLSNVGKNTFVYDEKYYIYKGKFNNVDYETKNVPTDRVRIPFGVVQPYSFRQGSNNSIYLYAYSIDVERLTGRKLGTSYIAEYYLGSYIDFVSIVNEVLSKTSFPVGIFGQEGSDQMVTDFYTNYSQNLSIVVGSTPALDWQYKSQEALDDSEAGLSIKKGNAAQKTKTVVREGSVPIKRSSLKEEERNGEKVVSGDIGWDIPRTEVITAPILDDTKEDEFIEDIGIIDVPEDVIIDDPVPGEIVIPGDEDIVIPVTPDVPIPIIKLLEIQYGPFYPTSMDITEFFPFCIPFDFAYCVNKFRVGEGEAPVIDFPIVYPKKLQPILGESYHVVIDFNDYIFLRNIIRYFLLLSFLTGLMFATRSLIRG